MSGMSDFRQQHPEYSDLSDTVLADKLHAKFYSDMPKDQYYKKLGIELEGGFWSGVGDVAKNVAGAIGEPVMNMASGMIAKPAADIAGLAATAKEMISPTEGGGDPAGFRQHVLNSLTFTPKTAAGKVTTEYNPIALVGKAVGGVANVAGDAADYVLPGSGATTGMAGNLVREAIPQAAGILGTKYAPEITSGVKSAGNAVSGVARSGAERLMNSALKPTVKAHASGDAAIAVNTLLDRGINATKGGSEKLHALIDDLNTQIADRIKTSGETVSKESVIQALDDVRNNFANQVDPVADLAAIDKVAENFANHPKISGIENPATAGKSIFVDQSGNVVKDVVVPTAPKLRSLLGELKANGGLSPAEVADIGIEKLNTTAPGLLNKATGKTMDGVVEWMNQNGWLSDQDIKRADKSTPGGSHELARDMIRNAVDKNPVIHPTDGEAFYNYNQALQDLSDQGIIKVKIPGEKGSVEGGIGGDGDSIPIQLAQMLKQGTNKIISKKYGQLGAADVEAQKALVRGLKEEIAKAAPEVADLNSKESALIRTLKVTERRALMDLNKNPMGLALLAHSPLSWAAFMADKSALFKSIAARMMNVVSRAGVKIVDTVPSEAVTATSMPISSEAERARRKKERAVRGQEE